MAATAISFKAQVAQRVTVKASQPKVTVQKAIVASANSRREVLSFGALTAAALVAGKANAVEDYTIYDFQAKTKSDGFYNIYEARDLDVTQETKPGAPTRMAMQKLAPSDTVSRVKESAKRIETVLPPLIEKEYYPVAQRELRNQIGYLRFDLEFLASLKSGADKASAVAASKDLIKKIEALDFQLRSKSLEGSQEAYSTVVGTLGPFVSTL
uniref:Oxygen-evolving enhancer protein 3 n=1 Tax=Pyramimonas obovata TaxID=1411642 RepID=A0A7S0RBU9_9CHLO